MDSPTTSETADTCPHICPQHENSELTVKDKILCLALCVFAFFGAVVFLVWGLNAVVSFFEEDSEEEPTVADIVEDVPTLERQQAIHRYVLRAIVANLPLKERCRVQEEWDVIDRETDSFISEECQPYLERVDGYKIP